MKTNRFGRAEILSPHQISLLFTEGFTRSRDRALFGVCLYTAARINEACTLLTGDVIGVNGVREKIVSVVLIPRDSGIPEKLTFTLSLKVSSKSITLKEATLKTLISFPANRDWDILKKELL